MEKRRVYYDATSQTEEMSEVNVMNKFEVNFEACTSIVVEAETEEEAEQKAIELAEQGTAYWEMSDINEKSDS